MNMKLLLTVILLVATVVVTGDQFAQVYCGRRLAQTLGALCSTNYLVKRSEMYGLDGWGAAWSPETARALSGSRGKRQVVSECCEKACTLDELLTYC